MRLFVLVALGLVNGAVVAQPAGSVDHDGDHATAAVADSAVEWTQGEVRRVDHDAQKVTLRHGPIPNLGMPDGMTMVFRVSDPAMLDRVNVGDKVRFKADKIGGQYTVTQLEVPK